MATVFRIKRRNDDEPWDALIVACKKQKVDDAVDHAETSDSKAFQAFVKFAGTVKNAEENVVDHIAKNFTKDQLISNYKKRISDEQIRIKNRLKNLEESRENRYKVVNKFRSIGTLDTDNIDDKEMTVIDIEDSLYSSAVNSTNIKDDSYVYDLYYTKTDEDIIPENDISILPYEQELVFDNFRDDVLNNQDESDDSNSESNWRNDYPDSDHSENSINDEDMVEAVRRLKVDGDESDLSSENPDYVYSVDEADVNNYGYKYAKYKAKFLKETEDTESDNESEDAFKVNKYHDDEDKDDIHVDDMDDYDKKK